jgi:hypothetical protein
MTVLTNASAGRAGAVGFFARVQTGSPRTTVITVLVNSSGNRSGHDRSWHHLGDLVRGSYLAPITTVSAIRSLPTRWKSTFTAAPTLRSEKLPVLLPTRNTVLSAVP